MGQWSGRVYPLKFQCNGAGLGHANPDGKRLMPLTVLENDNRGMPLGVHRDAFNLHFDRVVGVSRVAKSDCQQA